MIQNVKNMTWAAGIPRLDLESFNENPAEMTCGWNFLQDSRNLFEVDGKKWLYQRVLQHEKLRQKMLQRSMFDAGEINWRKDAVKTYMHINDADDSDRNTIREVDDGHRRLQEHSRLTSRYNIGQKYPSKASDVHDLQAGHSTRTAGMIYGRDLMESPFHTINQREGFRGVSIEWHQILQFKHGGKGIPKMEDLKTNQSGKTAKKLLGPTAKFKGIQRPVLDAIKQR
ncbi:hypothetical protein K3495_g8479 [Podosphaera aphanis]|nr:hypothetical protein K3495_g8479 [Podosphaera aphanis]